MKVENDGKVYHTGCFACAACKGSLKNRKVRDLNGELYHIDCFNQLEENVSKVLLFMLILSPMHTWIFI